MALFMIHAYHNDGLSYGGGEEGGWWYPTFSYERPILRLFETREEAVAAAARCFDWTNRLATKGRVPPVSSMSYCGGRYMFTVEDAHPRVVVPKYLPVERPYYS